MPSVCVDANLVLRLLMPDERNERAEALWSSWARGGVTRLGPPLLYAEVTSVIRESVFFGRITPGQGAAAFEEFCGMAIAISTRPNLHLLAWELARRFNRRRAYDSFYLAAAQAEGCELWTGDQRLFNAVSLPWVRWVGDYPA
jgi:predicted nucleic acid-binding protein